MLDRVCVALNFRDKKLAIVVVAAILVGIGLRFAWAIFKPPEFGLGEAEHVAIAIASGRGFADAYRLGQGPTAHLMPISPAIGGAIYWAFGIGSLTARMVLAASSISFSIGSYLLFNRAFARLGVPEFARAAALSFLCVVPLYVGQEAQMFGFWEGGLAVLLAALVAVQLCGPLPQAAKRYRVVLAATCALAFFVNPIMGLASGAAALLRLRGEWRMRELASFVLLAAIFTALLIGPWALRNQRLLGQPVLTRSNSGLELAIGTNPQMLGDLPRGQAFEQWINRLHPARGDAAYAAMQKVGEVAYSQALGAQARSWIRTHPADEARLVLLHLRTIFIPEPWLFTINGPSSFAQTRSVIESAIGTCGLLGILVGLIRFRRWQVIAALILVPTLVLAPFQPTHRYLYLFYAMLVFSAAYLLACLFEFLLKKRATPRRSCRADLARRAWP